MSNQSHAKTFSKRHKDKKDYLMKKILLAIIPLFLLGACSQEQSQEESNTRPNEQTQATTANTADLPTYLVCTINSFPPFAIRDENTRVQGFDVDLLTAVGQKAGFNVQFLVSPWPECLPSLDSGKRDIVGVAVTMTPERVEQYTFSKPYLDTGFMAVLKEKKGESNITDFKDIYDKKDQYRFVTQTGTAGVYGLKSGFGKKESEIIQVDDQYSEIVQVMTHKADVAYDISRVLEYYVHKANMENAAGEKLYGLINPDVPKETFGYAVKKGRTDLAEKINEGLQMVWQDGTYAEIYKKWFGGEPDEDLRKLYEQ